MADIRAVTAELDLSGGPEAPMRLGGRFGPVDTSYAENALNSSPDFGAWHANDTSGGIWWSLYTESVFHGDVEVWGTAIGGQLGAAGEGYRLGIFEAASLGGGGTARGYIVLSFHALGDAHIIREYSQPGSFVNLASTGGAPPWNRKMLFRRVGNTLECWEDSNGTGQNWTLIVSATDSTYQGPWQIAWGTEDPTHGGLGWTAVGGGQKNKPQIYRWVKT